jgi:glutamate 5-kinase
MRIVFKFGTNILRGCDGDVATERINSFIEDMCALIKGGHEIIIVTSGAVGLGAKRLNLLSSAPKRSIFDKQAFASVGQPLLMRIWDAGFEKFGIIVSQILLTEDDFSNRKKYLNLRSTLSTLLGHGVVPIINQNDSVCSAELTSEALGVCFSDNDKLSALVASKLDADLLVIVSDIDGLYDKNPKEFEDAKLICTVKKVTPEIEALASGATLGGTGGMFTKLMAAKIVNSAGAEAKIVNGKLPDIIRKIFDKCPETPSTTFFADEKPLSGKKRWIAFATNIMGRLIVNENAKIALVENNKSLLSVGIVEVEGEFSRTDVVCICDENGNVIAHGIANYDASECRAIMGKHSDMIAEVLGTKLTDDVVTKDNLVIL